MSNSISILLTGLFFAMIKNRCFYTPFNSKTPALFSKRKQATSEVFFDSSLISQMKFSHILLIICPFKLVVLYCIKNGCCIILTWKRMRFSIAILQSSKSLKIFQIIILPTIDIRSITSTFS